jgi:hypothetical protein
MAGVTLQEARELLELVIGPEEIVAKVQEFKFASKEALLAANGLSAIPPLPSKEKCLLAKEQKKALIFRVTKDGERKDVALSYLKERFGGLIYSAWYLNPPAPFALEHLTAGWALVDLDPLPGSAEKNYQEQIEYAKEKGARLKSTVADAYDLLVAYKVTGKFFRDEPLNGRTATVVEKEPIKISHFDKSGMCISTGWGATVKHADIGAATELTLP